MALFYPVLSMSQVCHKCDGRLRPPICAKLLSLQGVCASEAEIGGRTEIGDLHRNVLRSWKFESGMHF